jgi:hypothetical protein
LCGVHEVDVIEMLFIDFQKIHAATAPINSNGELELNDLKLFTSVIKTITGDIRLAKLAKYFKV